MKQILFALLLVSYSVVAFAAPATYMNSERELLIDGKKYEMHFWRGGFDLGDALAKNPVAQAEYAQYEKLLCWSSGLNWGALAAGLTYAVSNSSTFNSGTFWTIFLVPWIAGIVVHVKADTHFIKAMNIYNGVPPDQAEFQFRKADDASTVLQYAWSF